MKDKREDKDYTNENNQMLGISRSVTYSQLTRINWANAKPLE